MDVLSGFLFVVILSFETLYGRIKLFQPREASEGTPAPGPAAKNAAVAAPAV